MAANFEIERKGSFMIIKCNGMIHLMVEQPIAIQSWIEGFDEDEVQKKFCIEYTSLGGHEVLTEYNRREKWETILGLLDTHFSDASLQAQA